MFYSSQNNTSKTANITDYGSQSRILLYQRTGKNSLLSLQSHHLTTWLMKMT